MVAVVLLGALVVVSAYAVSQYLPSRNRFTFRPTISYRGAWQAEYRGYKGTAGFLRPQDNFTWGTFSGTGPGSRTIVIVGDNTGGSICVTAMKSDPGTATLTLSLDGASNSTSASLQLVTVCESAIAGG